MKTIALSVITVMAISTFAMAGGDIAPVEPVVETPAVVETPGHFYIGVAYSLVKNSGDAYYTDGDYEDWGTFKTSDNAVMLQAGYAFNNYFALEGRYWTGSADVDFSWEQDGTYSEAADFSAYGIYLKPMLPITEEFTVYGLLGYGNVKSKFDTYFGGATMIDESGFQYGAGVSYAVTENISLFVDYVNLGSGDSFIDTRAEYEEWTDQDPYTINFGVTYTF